MKIKKGDKVIVLAGKDKGKTGEVLRSLPKFGKVIVAGVNVSKKHAKYQKFIKQHKKYKAHDAGNTCKIGDLVTIKETRPISKDKHFIVVK